MNVTKVIAEDVATSMLKPIKNKIDSVKLQMIEEAQKFLYDSIPKEIKELFIKHPNYFQKAKEVTISCEGVEITIYGLEQFPSYTNYIPRISTDKGTMDKFKKLELERKSLRAEYTNTEKSIVSTMLSFRTFKRIKEGFPEAYKHLERYENKKSDSTEFPVESIINTINKHH